MSLSRTAARHFQRHLTPAERQLARSLEKEGAILQKEGRRAMKLVRDRAMVGNPVAPMTVGVGKEKIRITAQEAAKGVSLWGEIFDRVAKQFRRGHDGAGGNSFGLEWIDRFRNSSMVRDGVAQVRMLVYGIK